MNELKFQSKILEVYYANETFRYRFFNQETASLNPVQKAFTSKVPFNILNALLNRLYETITNNYSLENLRNIGKLLYQQLIPTELSEALNEKGQAITIVSEDYSIPWELLHDNEDFLGVKHFIGRCLIWNLTSNYQKSVAKKHKSCLIISNPTGDLTEAEAETVTLMDFLRRKGINCTYLARAQATLDEILLELSSGDYDFIHYSGHIAKDPKSGQYAFALENENYLPVGSIGQLTIGRPFVFLNGCGTGKVDNCGESEETDKNIEGVAVSFLNAGASSVVSTLWKVSDTGARKFAESVYLLLLSGESIGEALLISRRKMQSIDISDPAWAAFILYGNPGLCFSGGKSIESTLEEEQLTIKSENSKESIYVELEQEVKTLLKKSSEDASTAGKQGKNKNRFLIRIGLIAASVIIISGLFLGAYKLFFSQNNDNSLSNQITRLEELPAMEKAFPDSIFRDEIIKYLQKSQKDITIDDLAGIRVLDIFNKGINSLEGIQYLSNLEELNANRNKIKDLKPLTNLISLKLLNLDENNISDINPIKSLNKIEELRLSKNKIISGIKVIAGFKQLSKLNLNETGISEMSFVSELINLTELQCGHNKITNIDYISRLKGLENLYLWGGYISDIKPLAGLDQLVELTLGGNRIIDITPLSKLSKLTNLDLRYNRIRNLEPIAGLSNLEELSLEGNEDIRSYETLKSIYGKLLRKDFKIQ